MKHHRCPRRWFIGSVILPLIGLTIIPISSQAAPDHSPQAVVERASKLAG